MTVTRQTLWEDGTIVQQRKLKKDETRKQLTVTQTKHNGATDQFLILHCQGLVDLLLDVGHLLLDCFHHVLVIVLSQPNTTTTHPQPYFQQATFTWCVQLSVHLRFKSIFLTFALLRKGSLETSLFSSSSPFLVFFGGFTQKLFLF